MAKFRCKISGVVVEFVHPVDIITTSENPAYEEIEDGMQTEEGQKPEKEVKTKKVKTKD